MIITILWMIIIVISSYVPIDKLISASNSICIQEPGNTYIAPPEFSSMTDNKNEIVNVIVIRCIKKTIKKDTQKEIFSKSPYYEL